MPRLTFIKKYGIILKKDIFKKQENKIRGEPAQAIPEPGFAHSSIFI